MALNACTVPSTKALISAGFLGASVIIMINIYCPSPLRESLCAFSFIVIKTKDIINLTNCWFMCSSRMAYRGAVIAISIVW